MGATADKNGRVGFVFPVYARGLPHLFKTFVDNLEIKKGAYLFAVANFGNYPALSFLQIKELIEAKGARLSSVFGVPMPGNMWSMYYPRYTRQDIVDRITAQYETTADIAIQIKKSVEIPISEMTEKLREEEERYRDFIPNHRDEGFWTDSTCNGCGICGRVCPAGNIEIIDSRPDWKHRCEFCRLAYIGVLKRRFSIRTTR